MLAFFGNTRHQHTPLRPFWSLNDFFRWPKPGTDGLGSPGCNKYHFSKVPSSFCPVILMICFFEKVIQYRWIRPLPSSNLIWLWKITMQCLIGNSSVIRAIFHSYVELLEGDLIFPEFVAIFMAKMMMVWREQYPEGGLTNEGDYFPTSCKKGWWGKYEENRNGIGP